VDMPENLLSVHTESKMSIFDEFDEDVENDGQMRLF
jgi:hypothetical protein